VSWAEVTHCMGSGDAAALTFTAPQVLERVERQGDLFAPVLTLTQQLPGVPITGVKTEAKATSASSKGAVARKPTAGQTAEEKPRTAPAPHRIKRAG
jgi:hypothetical protein